jgi:hypothetical protein
MCYAGQDEEGEKVVAPPAAPVPQFHVERHPLPVKLLFSESFDARLLRKDFVIVSHEAKPWSGPVEGEKGEEERSPRRASASSTPGP